jgi:hypothetical protein
VRSFEVRKRAFYLKGERVCLMGVEPMANSNLEEMHRTFPDKPIAISQ